MLQSKGLQGVRQDLATEQQQKQMNSESTGEMQLAGVDNSINLLSLFIRKQTELKPQSQKTNQIDHMDHSLV